jgi:phage repressor protein C with HTH and peptisase S24 domain
MYYIRDMRTLAERLIWARDRKGLTQAALAKLSGVSQGTIGNLESGLRQSARKIANIADAMGVDALWLAEGKGQPGVAKFDPNSIEDNGALIAERIARARSDAVIAGDLSYKNVLVSDIDTDDVSIRMVELRLSAGHTGFVAEDIDDRGSSTIKVDRAFIESNGYIPNRLVAIKVKGESMEPKLSNGDTVIINTADTKPVDGTVFAVNYEGEAVIKRLSRDAGEWWLTSDNPDQRKYHRKICRGNECIIVGRAVRAFTDNI